MYLDSICSSTCFACPIIRITLLTDTASPELLDKNLIDALDKVSTPEDWRSGRMMTRMMDANGAPTRCGNRYLGLVIVRGWE